MILALAFSLCAVCAYGNEYEGDFDEDYEDWSTRRINDPFASRANIQLRMDATPPYASWMEREGRYSQKEHRAAFRQDETYWVIDELPKGSIFTVLEGYKARCVSFHTKVALGKAGKALDNGRVIYSSGTNVKYTYPSFLHLYRD